MIDYFQFICQRPGVAYFNGHVFPLFNEWKSEHSIEAGWNIMEVNIFTDGKENRTSIEFYIS